MNKLKYGHIYISYENNRSYNNFTCFILFKAGVCMRVDRRQCFQYQEKLFLRCYHQVTSIIDRRLYNKRELKKIKKEKK